MCGLAGFWHPDSSSPEAALHDAAGRMTDAIAHRGPDDRGTWADADAGVVLGFRRLAILDLSPTGHQPMRSPDGRYVVVFNGEIYNYQDLRGRARGPRRPVPRHLRHRGDARRHRALGRRPRPSRACGACSPSRCGIAHERTLWIARDRLGKKPLYYGWAGGTFLFGSELKALRAHPGVPDARVAARRSHRSCASPTCRARTASTRACTSCCPGRTRSIRDGQAHGDALLGSARRGRRGRGASVACSTTRRPSTSSTALLRDATRRRMIADVPLGAFLSGGIDSSAVVALMQAGQRAARAHVHHRLRRGRLRRSARRGGRGRASRHRRTPSSTSRPTRRAP